PGAFSNTVAESRCGPTAAPQSSRRRRWQLGLRITAGLLLVAGLAWWGLIPADHNNANEMVTPMASKGSGPADPPLRTGFLYPGPGPMAISERSPLDGVLLAVGEINDMGGVLGRRLETVIEDGQSDETVFAHKAAKLIDLEHVSALFGTWTSAS